jgi:cell division inhibitor SepF
VGFADLWNRTLVYFGIAEEDEYWDEDGYATNEELERTYSDRPNVRRLPRRSRDEYEDWTDSDPETAASPRAVRHRPRAPREAAPVAARPRRLEAAPSPSVRVHLILPRSFNDAQQIADKFKDHIPVILNLQATDQELSKRLIDFASGLTYALNGGMQRVADKVFLLTPRNVEVSAEERAKLLERGGFFNQA